MSLAAIGIIVCALIVMVCVAICMAHQDGNKQWRVGKATKDTDRRHDAGFWS